MKDLCSVENVQYLDCGGGYTKPHGWYNCVRSNIDINIHIHAHKNKWIQVKLENMKKIIALYRSQYPGCDTML